MDGDMEARAVGKYLKMSAKKVIPVVRLVRNRPVEEALASLQAFTEGLFSSRPGDDPLRVDAAALVALDTRRLGEVLHDELEVLQTFGIGATEHLYRDVTAGPGPDIT